MQRDSKKEKMVYKPLGWDWRGKSRKELKQKIKWSDTDFE
jgi:hypothetical protein